MHLPKKILVPTDFSPPSDAALDYAIDLAALLGASVTIMHAYEIPVVGFPDGALVATAEIASRIMSASQAALDALAEARAKRGVPITKILKQDEPRTAIENVAEEMDADLIVVGTHGRRGLSRALLGSVAENVIRTSTRPVLAIREPTKK